MTVAVKRVYEAPAKSDGVRVLVDRLWPRGLSKAEAKVELWLKPLAPSDELRQWFHAHPVAFETFRKRYLKELRRPEAEEAVMKLHQLALEQPLTLVFAYKDKEHNNAVVLKDLLEGRRKPPTGTGPAAAVGRARQRRAARRPR
jgi:uncharacterized protein YeaO (DUF488 family)